MTRDGRARTKNDRGAGTFVHAARDTNARTTGWAARVASLQTIASRAAIARSGARMTGAQAK